MRPLLVIWALGTIIHCAELEFQLPPPLTSIPPSHPSPGRDSLCTVLPLLQSCKQDKKVLFANGCTFFVDEDFSFKSSSPSGALIIQDAYDAALLFIRTLLSPDSCPFLDSAFIQAFLRDVLTFSPSLRAYGSNGSIQHPIELHQPQNAFLDQSMATLSAIFNEIEASVRIAGGDQPSFSDLIALAAAEALRLRGGPEISITRGRRDNNAPDSGRELPLIHADSWATYRAKMAEKGFDVNSTLLITALDFVTSPFIEDSSASLEVTRDLGRSFGVFFGSLLAGEGSGAPPLTGPPLLADVQFIDVAQALARDWNLSSASFDARSSSLVQSALLQAQLLGARFATQPVLLG